LKHFRLTLHVSFLYQMEGSVEEGSARSDEEYEDLAICDGQDGGYWSDNSCKENTGEDCMMCGNEYQSLGVSSYKGKQQNCSQHIVSHCVTCQSTLNSHMCSKQIPNESSVKSEQYSRSMAVTNSTEPSSLNSLRHRVQSPSQSVNPFEKYVCV